MTATITRTASGEAGAEHRCTLRPLDFVINLTTTKALGLTIPESLLLRADEILSSRDVRYWHKVDTPAVAANVCFRG